MNKYLICLIFFAAQCFSQDVKVEFIPNSTLKVSFPSNWNFFKSHNDDTKYGSIQLHFPDDKSGGFAASPEFEFEFHNEQSEDEMLINLLKSELSSKEIGGVESKLEPVKNSV